MTKNQLRIGGGSAYANDRIEPALDLAQRRWQRLSAIDPVNKTGDRLFGRVPLSDQVCIRDSVRTPAQVRISRR